MYRATFREKERPAFYISLENKTYLTVRLTRDGKCCFSDRSSLSTIRLQCGYSTMRLGLLTIVVSGFQDTSRTDNVRKEKAVSISYATKKYGSFKTSKPLDWFTSATFTV